MSRGFTLIEVVVSIGIFALLAVMGSSLLFAILRGSKKADSTAAVRTEGAHVMDIMTSHLRFANAVTTCQANSITFMGVDNKPTVFTCATGGTDTYVASNSARLTSAGVSVVSCAFTCAPSSADVDSVNIELTLQRAGATVTESTAQVKLESQVQLRNR